MPVTPKPKRHYYLVSFREITAADFHTHEDAGEAIDDDHGELVKRFVHSAEFCFDSLEALFPKTLRGGALEESEENARVIVQMGTHDSRRRLASQSVRETMNW